MSNLKGEPRRLRDSRGYPSARGPNAAAARVAPYPAGRIALRRKPIIAAVMPLPI